MFDFVDKNGRRIEVQAHVVVDRKPEGGGTMQERSADAELKALLAQVPDSEFVSRPK